MPDFDSNLQPITPYEGGTVDTLPYNTTVPTILPGFENLASEVNSDANNFRSLDTIMSAPVKGKAMSIPQTVTTSELEANKRYTVYNPSISNQEDYASYGQSWLSQFGNALVKTGGLTLGTFAQGMFSIPD